MYLFTCPERAYGRLLCLASHHSAAPIRTSLLYQYVRLCPTVRGLIVLHQCDVDDDGAGCVRGCRGVEVEIQSNVYQGGSNSWSVIVFGPTRPH